MDTLEFGYEEPLEILAVINRSQYNPDRGQITPVAFVEEGSKYTPISDPFEEFPNSGNVWVSSEYGHLSENFKYGELFKIKAYKDDKEDYKSVPTRDKYWTKGSKAIKLDRLKLFPVIEVDELPTNSNPYFSEEIHYQSPFFLTTSEGQLYGPFALSVDEHGKQRVVALDAMQGAPIGLAPEYVYCADFADVQVSGLLENFVVNDENHMFINNADGKIQRQGWQQFDFISDDKLLSWGLRYLLPKENVRSSKKEIEKWKATLENIKSFEGDNEDRRLRLIKLVERIDSLDNEWEPLIKKAILENKKLIEDYIERNESVLIDKNISPLREKYGQERDKLEASISTLRNQKESLDTEVAELREKKKEVEIAHAQQAKENLEKEEQELLKKRDRLKKQIDELVAKHDLVLDYTELDDEINRKKTQYEFYNTELETLKSRDLPKTLAKLKTELSVLHGSYGVSRKPCNLGETNCCFREFPASDRKAYVRDIQTYLEDACNRSFAYDEIANLLISYQNSFFTVFAGAPGSGKTSTVRFLALALGLGKYFLPVRVARGWASQKDLLGYYNPINSTFQEARTGIYSLLKQIDEQSGSQMPLSQILLDEANLSPIEHYWADFLSMSDYASIDFRKVDIGSNDPEDNFAVQKNVRFVATINNDNTTEKLSPRLVDRATIIQLPELDISTTAYMAGEINPSSQLPIPYTSFEEMFSATSICSDEHQEDQILFSEVEIDKLKRVSSILSEGESVGQRIILSPRKINSIRSYCFAARNIFEEPNSALDFAIVQQILPVIEGFGEGFGEKLKRLLEEVARLPRTKNKLQDMLNKGQAAHHSYSFFS